MSEAMLEQMSRHDAASQVEADGDAAPMRTVLYLPGLSDRGDTHDLAIQIGHEDIKLVGDDAAIPCGFRASFALGRRAAPRGTGLTR